MMNSKVPRFATSIVASLLAFPIAATLLLPAAPAQAEIIISNPSFGIRIGSPQIYAAPHYQGQYDGGYRAGYRDGYRDGSQRVYRDGYQRIDQDNYQGRYRNNYQNNYRNDYKSVQPAPQRLYLLPGGIY
jgi:hypothetical protein